MRNTRPNHDARKAMRPTPALPRRVACGRLGIVLVYCSLGVVSLSALVVHGQDSLRTPERVVIPLRVAQNPPAARDRIPSSLQDALVPLMEHLQGLDANNAGDEGNNAPANVGGEFDAVEIGEQSHKLTIPMRGQTPTIELDRLSGTISLHVRDASIRDVLTLIAQQMKINIVFADGIDARISITLEDVTVENALDAMLSTTGHTWTRVNNIVHVTSLNATARFPAQLQNRVVRVFELDFASATDVDTVVKSMLSPVGTSQVMVTDETDNRRTRDVVIVEDLDRYVTRIEQYVHQLDIPPRQVMIEAYILEVELSDTRRNGVNFDTLAKFANNSLRLQTTGFASSAASQAFFIEVNGKNLTGLIELLETTADAKTLASPKVLAINGQKARIQIGERLGYRVTTTTETSSLESVEFIDVGVVLEVTPRVTRDGRVMMRVKPEVSGGTIDAATGLPSEDTTEVETDILLEGGRGIVIGGLIQERDVDNQSKLPGLGDLKWVGPLFQRRVHEKRRSEIIVVLVPHIMPYNCDIQQREDVQLERATTPLLWGPLDEYPRPWEPRLNNPYDNPKRLRDGVNYQASEYDATEYFQGNNQPVGSSVVDSLVVKSGPRESQTTASQTTASQTTGLPHQDPLRGQQQSGLVTQNSEPRLRMPSLPSRDNRPPPPAPNTSVDVGRFTGTPSEFANRPSAETRPTLVSRPQTQMQARSQMQARPQVLPAPPVQNRGAPCAQMQPPRLRPPLRRLPPVPRVELTAPRRNVGWRIPPPRY
jgi:type IV pilus assembly protein PilQ